MNNTPVQIVWIVKETLTDGSEVFNVEINLGTLHALSESDAYQLADEISAAANLHALETVDVMDA